MKRKIIAAVAALNIVILLGGCASQMAGREYVSTQEEVSVEQAETSAEDTGQGSDKLEDVADREKESQSADSSNVSKSAETTFDPEDVSEFSDHPYVEVNGNVPFFTEDEITTDVFEEYSPLDSLGRCGVAYANICKGLMPTEERGEIGMIKPSGWHTQKYPGVVEGNYIYNRCHLIGFQLAGENANEKNLITGTRYFNVDGMLPFENMVADYIDAHPDNHVLYRVTPEFVGDELVARGVLMEAYSVEDSGSGVSFCIYCYNAQPGVTIDYATGETALDENFTGEYAVSGASDTTTDKHDTTYTAEGQGKEKDISEETTYVVNTNTGKFHVPTCSSVTDMADKNVSESTQTRDELIAAGYSPCGRCNP